MRISPKNHWNIPESFNRSDRKNSLFIDKYRAIRNESIQYLTFGAVFCGPGRPVIRTKVGPIYQQKSGDISSFSVSLRLNSDLRSLSLVLFLSPPVHPPPNAAVVTLTFCRFCPCVRRPCICQSAPTRATRYIRSIYLRTSGD